MKIYEQAYNILLADDHMIVRQGVEFVCMELFSNAVFHHAGSLKKLWSILETHTIDIVVLDAQFPDGLSLQVIPDIRTNYPQLKILILSSFEEVDFSLKFIHAGANGYLSKLSEDGAVQVALQSLVEEGKYYSELTQKLLELSKYNPAIMNPLQQLSEREIEIAKLLSQGMGNLEIANELSLKQNTISTFKKRIFDKLQIQSIVELADILRVHLHT